jgi:chemotaxis protein methyltransferase CheR
MALSMNLFLLVRRFVHEEAGIFIQDDQDYLVEGRMSGLIAKEKIESLEKLYECLILRPYEYKKKVVEAMMTTETFFFRDELPFKIFQEKVLPEVIERKRAEKQLTIWSAACSSGQEPYSIAMILKENFSELSGWQVNIIATDISQDNIDKCLSGTYSSHLVRRGLPEAYLNRFFVPRGNDEWVIGNEIKSMVQFSTMNLLDYWSVPKPDIIFMRNVLIYFEKDIKRQIFNKIKFLLPGGGYLFLGSGETTLGIVDFFQPVYADKTVYFRMI